jgi:type II secretory pathway pseudopilin PulG
MSWSRISRRLAGLTLVELMLSLAITGMTGAAVVAIVTAVAYGSQERDAVRRLTVKHKVLASRIDAMIRSSQRVLAADQNDDFTSLLLWIGDANDDETPNLDEMQLIELNRNDDTLRRYEARFPTNWTKVERVAANVSYTMAADFTTVARNYDTTSNVAGELWANDVADWRLQLDAHNPANARLVSYQLTINSGDQQHSIVCAAALRSDGQ